MAITDAASKMLVAAWATTASPILPRNRKDVRVNGSGKRALGPLASMQHAKEER